MDDFSSSENTTFTCEIDVRALRALRTSESRFRRLFESTLDGILLLNAETGRIEEVNPYLLNLLGYVPAELIGQKLWDVSAFSATGELQQMFAAVQSEKSVRYDDLSISTKTGHAVRVEFIGSAYESEGIDIIQCNIRDITARRQMEDQLRQHALYDALTDLPNRRLFRDRASQAMAASQRSCYYGALMFIDLDNFKLLNDMHGHDVGDLLLIEVAHRLKSCMRAVDTVARFGGDEFVIILSDLHTNQGISKSQAGIVAEKIRATLSQPFVMPIRRDGEIDTVVEHQCTASIGVAMLFDHQVTLDAFIKRADKAMYQFKMAGGNCVRYHEA